MDQLFRHIISFIAPTAIVLLLLFSVQIRAQNCMDVPADLNWTCIDEDDTFIYDDSEGVVITDCLGTTSDLNPLVTISVDIEEDCPNTGFVRNINNQRCRCGTVYFIELENSSLAMNV